MRVLKEIFIKSWVFTWLFVFLTAANGQISHINDPITGIVKEKVLNRDSGSFASGVALATGCDGELYALFDSPPQLIVWQANNQSSSEYSNALSDLNAPSDLASDGGFELLVVDPWHESILRFNRKLDLLPVITPDAGNQSLEPVSICRIADGTLYLINRADDDIWKIDRSGKAVPLGWSPARSGLLEKPSRIDYAASVDKLVILDADGVKLSSPYGLPGKALKISVKNPSSIGINNTEAWIVGDGLSCISLITKSEIFFVPADTLKSWDAYPAVDVAPADGQRIYLLPEKGDRVLVLEVIRARE
ncbi:MAG: hypothetical protein P9X24_18670 [Candidatus Hatepunaea meridiana]|nr:hypothetical protein [Candidatus Hatepunaea meridiana]